MVHLAPSRDRRLVLWVALGLLLGLAYTAFDLMAEERLASGTLHGSLLLLHTVVDRASPVLVGALLGAFIHALSLRAELSRVDALRARLSKVERDQAVWVLVAAVLHEVNNPIHALGLLLDEHGAEPDDGEKCVLLERAKGQLAKVRGRLAQLRAMRHLAEPDLSPVALDAVVREVAGDAAALAAADRLVVRAECDAKVAAQADATYVRTILESLVHNALSALRAGGGREVLLRLTAANGTAFVEVTDDAPPIDETAGKDLFEPLRTTKTDGLGLGLPIARALARAMRGEVSWAGGKSFRLELPSAP